MCLCVSRYVSVCLSVSVSMYVCVCVSMLTSDSRASSLLRGSASRKLATDRDMNMSLWKNYVVMCCCIAPPSHTATVLTTDYRCVTPELTTVLVCLSLSLTVCVSVGQSYTGFLRSGKVRENRECQGKVREF